MEGCVHNPSLGHRPRSQRVPCEDAFALTLAPAPHLLGGSVVPGRGSSGLAGPRVPSRPLPGCPGGREGSVESPPLHTAPPLTSGCTAPRTRGTRSWGRPSQWGTGVLSSSTPGPSQPALHSASLSPQKPATESSWPVNEAHLSRPLMATSPFPSPVPHALHSPFHR